MDDGLSKIKLLEKIIAKSPGHLYWKNLNGVYMGCNDAQAKVHGFSCASELIGKSEYDLLPADQAEQVIKTDRDIAYKLQESSYNKTVTVEEQITYPSGRKVTYLSTKEPLFDDDGKLVGILGTSLDITDLKNTQEREKQAIREAVDAKTNAQAQEEIQKAILTFTGTMSHDLRTPLSTISLADALLHKTLPALISVYNEFKNSNPNIDQDDPRYIHTRYLKLVGDSYKSIAEALKQAESYIDATLKIIRGVASGSELIKKDDLVCCGIEEIARRVVRDFPYQDGEEEKVHLDTMQSFNFMGNSIFMARILQNLLKNSFEQIRAKGKGEVFIWCEEGETNNSLYIKDTAGGVTQATIDQLFAGFNSAKKGGTGIGLSSAKQIMQAFGGDISCRPVNDDCIEFTLTFPEVEQEQKNHTVI